MSSLETKKFKIGNIIKHKNPLHEGYLFKITKIADNVLGRKKYDLLCVKSGVTSLEEVGITYHDFDQSYIEPSYELVERISHPLTNIFK
jgi:hypothetical protein